jgi:hypothetical protein
MGMAHPRSSKQDAEREARDSHQPKEEEGRVGRGASGGRREGRGRGGERVGVPGKGKEKSGEAFRRERCSQLKEVLAATRRCVLGGRLGECGERPKWGEVLIT